MFGKPGWFNDKKWGWGLHPVTWQGWAYAGVWFVVIAAPFLILVFQGKPTSGGIWMAAAIATLIWDVRQMKYANKLERMSRATDLYIDDEVNASLATKKFDMEVRR